jgi:hypothetical protein
LEKEKIIAMIKLKDILAEDCWKGYRQVGMKKKGKRMVPNCVPVKEDVGDDFDRLQYYLQYIKNVVPRSFSVHAESDSIIVKLPKIDNY